jgi:WD40 repeat protein
MCDTDPQEKKHPVFSSNYVVERLASIDHAINEPLDVHSLGIFAFGNDDGFSISVLKNGVDEKVTRIELTFYPKNLKISSDGKMIAVSDTVCLAIYIVTIRDLKESWIEFQDPLIVSSIVWSNDSKKIACITGSSTLRIFSVETCRPHLVIETGHLWNDEDRRFNPFFSVDDTEIITIERSEIICMWDTSKGILNRSHQCKQMTNLIPTSDPEIILMISSNRLCEIMMKRRPVLINPKAETVTLIGSFFSLSTDEKLFAWMGNGSGNFINIYDMSRGIINYMWVTVGPNKNFMTGTEPAPLMTRRIKFSRDSESLFAIDDHSHLLVKIQLYPAWSIQNHKLFPTQTRMVIKMMIIMAKTRVTMTVLSNNKRKIHSVFIPREIMLHIFSFLQLNK